MLKTSADGVRDLHIDAFNPVPAVRTPPGSELRLGSQDLVRFAAYAFVNQLHVESFQLADPFLMPLNPDDEGEISDDLVEKLQKYGGDEVEAALQDEYEDIYVVGVILISPSSGRRISVRRRGFVDTSITHEAERLLASAWKELQLS